MTPEMISTILFFFISYQSGSPVQPAMRLFTLRGITRLNRHRFLSFFFVLLGASTRTLSRNLEIPIGNSYRL